MNGIYVVCKADYVTIKELTRNMNLQIYATYLCRKIKIDLNIFGLSK